MIWFAMLGTLVIIVAITTAIWKLKKHRKKSVDKVFSNCIENEMPISVLYPRGLNPHEEETE